MMKWVNYFIKKTKRLFSNTNLSGTFILTYSGMTRTFGANKSILLGILLWGVVLNAFYNFGLQGILNLEPVHLIVQPLILLLVGTIWFGIQYIVTNEQLKIKLGPFTTFTVEVKNIESISRSYNPLSSPAPSLRRINLRFRNGAFLLLSPANEQEFIRILSEINPSIRNNVKNGPSKGLIKLLNWIL